MMRRVRFCAGTLLALTLILAVPSSAQQSGSVFDHGRFDRLLAEHVTPAGLVDYEAFEASEDFGAYLSSLANVDIAPLPRSERLALWINAYNAYTIELINHNDERESIRNINKTLGFLKAQGPWKERFAEVGGYTYTLDEIEHEVIRPRFGEPRIHFALVCAAMSCPPLRPEAYNGRDLDEQLDDQARAFLREYTDKNRIDVAERTVYLSRIFDWYREDFPEGREAFGRYLAPFFPDGPGRTVLESGDFDVEFTDYDWSLN
ncbi:MAG: DUF547 domain-containing protein, partial [Gemmatimonadota bacterium]